MIIPSALYPSQTAADANYPQGKARNVTASNDGTGFPFEAQWINDWLGFCQALALAAGITPTGAVENANTSQLLAAVRAVAQQRAVAVCNLTSVSEGYGATFPLTLASQYGGYSQVGNQIQCPSAGQYRVTLTANATSTDTSNPAGISALLYVGTTNIDVGASRYTATTTTAVRLVANYVFTVVTPSTDKIYLVSNCLSASMQLYASPQLVIERVA